MEPTDPEHIVVIGEFVNPLTNAVDWPNIGAGISHSLSQAMQHEALNQRFSALDEDHHNAATAFANKEQPVFRGR